MLTPAYTEICSTTWAIMPKDTNGVESLNKTSVRKDGSTKTLEAVLTHTYQQDRKVTLEHILVSSGLPVSFQWRTYEKIKKRRSAQNVARAKRAAQNEVNPDDIGLKGELLFYA